MGRKVHPIGMRLGINQGWQGRWFAEGSQYRDQLHQDFAIRSLLMGIDSKGGAAKNTDVRKLRKDLPDTVKNGKAGISRVEVERYPGKVRIAIHTAKPGILIGRKGEGVKKIVLLPHQSVSIRSSVIATLRSLELKREYPRRGIQLDEKVHSLLSLFSLG